MASTSKTKRIVVFTAGKLQRDLEVFLEQLNESQHIELAGVVVDQWTKPWQRLNFLRKRWGLRVFGLSIVYRLFDLCKLELIWRKWHDACMPVTQVCSFESLRDTGIPVYFVDDINSKRAAQEISSLSPDLGVIVGGRILKDRITQLPRLGTLNIHKHDATKYRGSPQIGYPERKNNDTHLGVTIHFAISKVDQGDIVSMAQIPIEEFDDDRSIAVKATVHGMKAYLQAIEAVATGEIVRQPQRSDSGETYITTPFVERFRFWRSYRRGVARTFLRPGAKRTAEWAKSVYRSVRFGTCLAALPWLVRKRRQMEQAGHAPIVMLYYHGVGNGGENWMTLPMHRMHEDVAYLHKHFKIISLDEAVSRLRSGKNYETAAVLTFDDGYASCYDNLVPYLNYYQVPGTIFCCPGASAAGSLHAHDADNGCYGARLMTSRELATASSEFVTIGSHGNFHENMGSLKGDALEQAVVQSGLELERITRRPMSYFSFPFGKKHHMSAEALQRGSKQYDAMFSAYGGYNFPDSANRLHFQRIANPQTLTSLIAIMNGLHRFRPFYTDRPENLGDPPQAQEAPRHAA